MLLNMFSIKSPIRIKQFAMLLLLCISMSYVKAQTTILTQTFDFPALFPPFGWTNTMVAGAGAPGNWSRVTTGGSPIQEPHSDPAEAKFNSYYYAAGTAGDLSSEVIDFTTVGTYTVNFWMYRDAGNGNDKMEVYVNTTQASAGGTLIGTVNRKTSLTPFVATAGWYNYTFTIPSSYITATNYVTFKGISDYGFNIYLDDITVVRDVITIPSCATGFSPVAGAVDVCSNTTLSWDVTPFATGYKLSLGNNAPNYNNVANNLDLGNVVSYSALLLNSTFYKWRIRPYNENGNAIGCLQNSFTTGIDVCYCIPQFIEPNCVSLDFIDDVYTTGAFTNISNLNTGCAGDANNYSYYSAFTIVGIKGSIFNLNLQSGAEYPQGYGVWADWNHDGDFNDAGEFVFQSATPTTAIVIAPITVPLGSTIGVTRLRIRAFYNEAPLATQACALWNEGESEDYNIQVTDCVITNYYFDGDGDGYGNPFAIFTTCIPPVGYVINNSDCNDASFAVNPGAPELCNGMDDNCNVTIDEGAAIAVVTPTGATTVCKGTNLILNANTGVGFTYQWTRNGGNVTGATASTYNVTKSGSYAVKVTVPGGCLATSTAISCTVTASPNASISTPEGTNLCGLPDLDLVANTGVGFTYIWIKNGIIVPGITTQIYAVSTIGDYRVKVTNAAGCSKTSAIKTVTTSCKIGETINDLNAYPNPSANLVNISFNLSGAIDGTLILTDMLGRNLINYDINFIGGFYNDVINVSAFAEGVYYITIISGNTKVVKEIIVSR